MFDEQSDAVVIAHALSMWANYIETGDVCMSAEDAERANEKFNALSTDQMKFVIRLREMETEARKLG